MAKAYVLRGQGLGLVMDKVFMSWPSKRDFDAVMAKELELHGFEKISGETEEDPVTVAARERWVRIQEIEVIGEKECDATAATFGPAPGELHEFVVGVLDPSALRAIAEVPQQFKSRGKAMDVEMSGTGTVINPGEPGHVADPSRMTITQADVAVVDAATLFGTK